MPQPNKIPLAFAASGDKNTIPENTETTGLASWREGFPAITSAPFSEGGIAPKRADFNGIFNALSLATLWQQQGGFYEYDATIDYEVGNVVEYNGDLYKCLSANGPSSAVKAPTDATVWSKVMTAADVAALYLSLSGGAMSGDISNAGTGFRRLLGGASVNDGAGVAVAHENNAQYPGEFWIFAKKTGVGDKSLIGKPDGTLTWDENSVEVVSAKSFGTSAYVYYKSGLQICCGYNVAPTTGGEGNTVTFPRAYKTAPFAVVSRRSGASTTGEVNVPWIREPHATYMNIYVPVYTGYYWIAVGEGA